LHNTIKVEYAQIAPIISSKKGNYIVSRLEIKLCLGLTYEFDLMRCALVANFTDARVVPPPPNADLHDPAKKPTIPPCRVSFGRFVHAFPVVSAVLYKAFWQRLQIGKSLKPRFSDQ